MRFCHMIIYHMTECIYLPRCRSLLLVYIQREITRENSIKYGTFGTLPGAMNLHSKFLAEKPVNSTEAWYKVAMKYSPYQTQLRQPQ